jgi:hypothetical protein
MSVSGPRVHDDVVSRFVLYHRHQPADCAASFEAWNGFASPLRGTTTISSCAFGEHEIRWDVTSTNEHDARAQLPTYVAERTVATRVTDVHILQPAPATGVWRGGQTGR